MRPLPFALGLVLSATAAYGLALALESVVPALAGHRAFTGATVGAFALLTAGIYAAAVPVARAENKARLTQYALLVTGLRMGVGVALVAAYGALGEPADLTYGYGFMIAYAVLTAYETYALVRLSYATAPRGRGGPS